jgi:hypothetical protein
LHAMRRDDTVVDGLRFGHHTQDVPGADAVTDRNEGSEIPLDILRQGAALFPLDESAGLCGALSRRCKPSWALTTDPASATSGTGCANRFADTHTDVSRKPARWRCQRRGNDLPDQFNSPTRTMSYGRTSFRPVTSTAGRRFVLTIRLDDRAHCHPTSVYTPRNVMWKPTAPDHLRYDAAAISGLTALPE